MAEYCIYECGNANCRLRFPARVGSLPSLRCPRCKAEIGVALELRLDHQVGSRLQRARPRLQLETLADNVRSGWNVGAMFRTADGLGVGKMHLCGITPSPEHPQVIKTALGAEKTVPWVYASNALQQCRALKSRGYSIWALEGCPQAETIFDLYNKDLAFSPTILVVGNEVTGIDPAILALCERILAIPMVGAKRSLNVAVAYGIAVSALLHMP